MLGLWNIKTFIFTLNWEVGTFLYDIYSWHPYFESQEYAWTQTAVVIIFQRFYVPWIRTGLGGNDLSLLHDVWGFGGRSQRPGPRTFWRFLLTHMSSCWWLSAGDLSVAAGCGAHVCLLAWPGIPYHMVTRLNRQVSCKGKVGTALHFVMSHRITSTIAAKAFQVEVEGT